MAVPVPRAAEQKIIKYMYLNWTDSEVNRAYFFGGVNVFVNFSFPLLRLPLLLLELLTLYCFYHQPSILWRTTTRTLWRLGTRYRVQRQQFLLLLVIMMILQYWHCCVRCYRDDTELQTTFKQKMTQTDDVCTLMVAGVTTKMSGTYSCVASNVAGTAKCSAVVTVVGKHQT